jgi:hypothetical protein
MPKPDAEIRQIAKRMAELLLGNSRDNEATAFPYWFVAVRAGSVGGVRMVSKGIWFNREDAEDHLRKMAYRYPKKAFVYCDSAHDSYTGLRLLYGLAKDLRAHLEAINAEA